MISGPCVKDTIIIDQVGLERCGLMLESGDNVDISVAT